MSKICHMASSLPVWHCPWHLVSDPDVARLGSPPSHHRHGPGVNSGLLADTWGVLAMIWEAGHSMGLAHRRGHQAAQRSGSQSAQ